MSVLRVDMQQMNLQGEDVCAHFWKRCKCTRIMWAVENLFAKLDEYLVICGVDELFKLSTHMQVAVLFLLHD